MNVTLTINGELEEVLDIFKRDVKVEKTVLCPEAEVLYPEPKAQTPDLAELTRDQIKKELEDLGIEYNNKCVTKTLAGLLEEKKAESTSIPAELNPVEACIAAEEAVSAPETTFEEAVEAVQGYFLKHDKAETLQLLSKFGVSKVSALDADQRAELIKIIKG